MTEKKWYTTTEFVDTETGEIIPKYIADKEYYIINKTIKYEINEKHGIRKHLYECRRSRQQTIDFN